MSLVRRFRIVSALITAAVAGVILLGAGTAGANPTVPTIPATPPEIVSTQAGGGAGGGGGANQMAGRSAPAGAPAGRGDTGEVEVLNTVLAQTGSNTGILVISGLILLVIGGSLVGGRRAYGN